MNTRNLVTGIVFELVAAVLVFNMITRGVAQLSAIGAILFFILGIAHLRRVKEY